MRKFALIALAASAAFIPAAAAAQTSHSQSQVTVRQHGGGSMHPGGHFRHQRLQRGFVIHPFWFGPQFHVRNWQLYGFPAPPADHRWVRYYDDAYMIDRRGRVRDHRYGLDWDEYGERWEMEDGIPSYYGRGDWRPGEEDYAWFERHGYGDEPRGYARDRRDRWEEEDYAYGDDGFGPSPGCHPQAPAPCGGSAAPYGYPVPYGYGVAYPIIIETTTVTTTGCCVRQSGGEAVEVRERPRRHRYRHRRHAPPAHHAPPHHEPPPPGERG